MGHVLQATGYVRVIGYGLWALEYVLLIRTTATGYAVVGPTSALVETRPWSPSQ